MIPNIIEESDISPAQRKAWARLIQKIYEVDPLTCPKCSGTMKIISFIEREEIIKKILKHLGLWELKVTRLRSPKSRLKPICKKAHRDDRRGLHKINLSTLKCTARFFLTTLSQFSLK